MVKVIDLDPKSPLAESFRTVRTNLSSDDINNNLKTILFTSTKQNEGKSTIASYLSYAFSKLENTKILVVDLDLRNPSIHKMFGISKDYGIMDYFKDGRDLDKCITKVEENLHILTSGPTPSNPTEILSSEKIENLLKNVREEYDYIFIDSPPVGVVSDGIIVSKYADGVIFVIGSNETDIDHTKEVIDNMKKSHINIIGAVLNKYDIEKNSYRYDSYYYKQDEESGRIATRNKRRFRLFRKKKRLGLIRY